MGTIQAKTPEKESEWTPQEWRTAQGIVIACVHRWWPSCRQHQAIVSKEDLQQVCLRAVHRAHKRFDAAKSKYTTFMDRVAECRIIDVMRIQNRLRAQDHAGARDEVVRHKDPLEILMDAEWQGPALHENGRNLAEYARDLYVVAKATFPRQRNRMGPRSYRPAQAVLVALIIRMLKLSNRQMWLLLKEDEALRNSLHLHRVPSRRWVDLAVVAFSEMAQKWEKEQNRSAKQG